MTILIRQLKHKAFLPLFLYRLILDISYYFVISPTYSYADYNLSIDIPKLAYSYVLFIVFSILIPSSNNKLSHKILQLHFVIIIIPMLTVYGLANLSTNFMNMISFCFLLQALSIRVLPEVKIRTLKNAKTVTTLLLVALSIATFVYSFKTQNIHFSVIDFAKVYDIRSDRQINSIMGYLIVWQFRIINPTIIIFSFFRKKFKLLAIGISMQLLLFFFYANKEIILSLLLIFAALYIEQKYLLFKKILAFGLSIGIGLSSILFFFTDNIIAMSIIPFRMLIVPAYIKFEHYYFFTSNKKLFYSEGVIGKIFGIKYPYNDVSGRLIKNGTWGNANTGYLAYAYDNSGFLGMILISLLFVMFLKYIDALVPKIRMFIGLPLLIYPMIILNDGDLLTLLLTGGLFLLVIIFSVYLKDFKVSKF